MKFSHLNIILLLFIMFILPACEDYYDETHSPTHIKIKILNIQDYQPMPGIRIDFWEFSKDYSYVLDSSIIATYYTDENGECSFKYKAKFYESGENILARSKIVLTKEDEENANFFYYWHFYYGMDPMNARTLYLIYGKNNEFNIYYMPHSYLQLKILNSEPQEQKLIRLYIGDNGLDNCYENTYSDSWHYDGLYLNADTLLFIDLEGSSPHSCIRWITGNYPYSYFSDQIDKKINDTVYYEINL